MSDLNSIYKSYIRELVCLDESDMIVYNAFMNRRYISVSSMLCRTYYDILGVDRNASAKEIKNAYYTLSKKYHPDATGSQPGNTTSTRFLEVSDAYDILKDSEKRRIYDSQISGGGHSSYTHDSYSYSHQRRTRTYSEDEMERIWKQYQDSARRNEQYQSEWPFGSNRYAGNRSRKPGTTYTYRSGPGWSYTKTTYTDEKGRQSSSYSYTDQQGQKQTFKGDSMEVNWNFLAKIFKIYMIAFFGVTLFQIVYGQTGSTMTAFQEEKRKQLEEFQKRRERMEQMMNKAPVTPQPNSVTDSPWAGSVPSESPVNMEQPDVSDSVRN